MAALMLGFYEAIKQEGVGGGQVRLAMMTGVSAQSAASKPDTPELIKKFANAYKEITGKACPSNLTGGMV